MLKYVCSFFNISLYNLLNLGFSDILKRKNIDSNDENDDADEYDVDNEYEYDADEYDVDNN